MRGLALLCIAAAIVAVMAEDSVQNQERIKRLDAQAHKLARLTAGVVNLRDRLNAREEARQRANLKSRAWWLQLDRKFGGKCKKGQFSCGTTSECVDYMLCCDGKNDCNNGNDENEDVCHPDIHAGNKWEGHFLNYDCNQEKLTDVSFLLTNVDRYDYLKGFAKVKGKLAWTDETNPRSKMAEQLIYDGIYTYGSRTADFIVDYHGESYHEHLYFLKGEKGVLHYDIFNASTMRMCGRAYMYKV